MSETPALHYRLDWLIPTYMTNQGEIVFFGKSKDAAPEVLLSEWPDTNRKYQQIRLFVEKFRYSVSGSYGSWTLELHGKALVVPLKGLQIVIEIQELEPFETPERLRDQWDSLPETIEGTCYFQRLNSLTHPDCFNVTLYCKSTALKSIFRALNFAGGQNVQAVLDIKIDAPSRKSDDFWRNSWQEEELRVLSWYLICEAGVD